MGLYLVDGSFEIFRCFHATPRSHGDEGQEVGAARGLFAQCVVGSRVVLLNRIRKERADEDDVRRKFGVSAAMIPVYLALVGDRSDGVPGLPIRTESSAAADRPLWPDRGDSRRGGEVGGGTERKRKLADMLRARRGEALLYRNLDSPG